jgi:hypothetical protein
MSDQDYERLVTSLERKYAKTIAAEARSAFLRAKDEGDEWADQAAHDAVVDALLADEAWEPVEAADISDIAWDAATEAEREARATADWDSLER